MCINRLGLANGSGCRGWPRKAAPNTLLQASHTLPASCDADAWCSRPSLRGHQGRPRLPLTVRHTNECGHTCGGK